MFRGDIQLTLDPKGRLIIPTRHRERLAEVCGGALVATIGLRERCLVIYPAPEWRRIEDHLKTLPALDEQAHVISHLLIGNAADLEMDNQGRVLVPPSLREWAGLDKRIRLVGQINKFELWDEDEWVARREAWRGEVSRVLSQPSDALRSLVL